MVHARITPWSYPAELDDLKKWFYAAKTGSGPKDERTRAIQRVKCYQSKGSQYLPHVVDSTAQITSAILLDEKRCAEKSSDILAVRLSYTMALIRFVNGLLDPTQQSQFAIPLHTLARRVGLSSWFVDLRHWGTHERELPSLDMLRTAAKEALEWLWDHYWNDEELEEEESSSDEQEDTDTVKEIEGLILTGIGIEDALIENRWVWDSGNRNLISNSNFEVNESTGQKKFMAISPSERINDYVARIRGLWRQEPNRKSVVEACIKNYSSILLELFMAKLSRFELELLSSVAQSYEKQVNGEKTSLKQKFPNWNELKRKLLKKFVATINLGMLATQWGNWESTIEAHPSYVVLWLCASILKRLHETNNQLPMRKKRKKRQNENLIELETKLSQLIQRLSKRFNDSDAKLYDLSSFKTTVSHTPKNPNDGTSDILDDLAKLRQRLTKPKTPAQEIKLWNRYPQWEPKPFGIL